MKTITVGQLRQNPTAMLSEVEAGESYRVTRHNRGVALVVPYSQGIELIGPKRRDGSHLASLPRHEVRSAGSIDELLADERDR